MRSSSKRGSAGDGSARSSSRVVCIEIRSPRPCVVRLSRVQSCYLNSARPAPVCSSVQPVPREQLGFKLAGDTKQCYACRKVQPTECFARLINKGVEYRNRRCNACRHRRQEGSPLVREKKDLLVAAKARPCADCGRSWPAVCMNFDHVRGTKLFGISSAVRWKSIEALQQEIAKCDIVCACCHRIRTETRPHHEGKKRGRPPVFLAKVGDATVEVRPVEAPAELSEGGCKNPTVPQTIC